MAFVKHMDVTEPLDALDTSPGAICVRWCTFDELQQIDFNKDPKIDFLRDWDCYGLRAYRL